MGHPVVNLASRGWSDLRISAFPFLPRFFPIITVALVTLATSSGAAHAQASADKWHRLAALQPGTHIHISSDKKSRTCFFASADDATLVCSRKNSGGTQYSFARADVRTVKLTRYSLSTIAGIGIGAGAGFGIGAAIAPAVAPKSNSGLDFSGLDREAITILGGAFGLIAGGAIGGPTDFLRGPTLYRRAGL
jgi:hypothetical protein